MSSSDVNLAPVQFAFSDQAEGGKAMNLTWAQAWLDTFDHTTDKAVDLYADDFTFEDVILQQRITDKQQLSAFFTNFANTDPALGVHTFTANSYTGTTESGTIQWSWRAQHAGDFMGFAAAGKETVTRGMTLHVYRDGKIASETTLWDVAAVLRQLSVVQ